MKNFVLAGVALATLGACQPLAEIKSAPANARLVDTSVKSRLAKGTSMVTVRAFTQKEDGGKGDEILGANCDLRSDALSARVSTPQQVVVPKFKQRAEFEDRGVPSALVVTCSAAGKSGREQITAVPKSTSVVTGAGAAGAILSIMASAAIASSTPWVYEGEVHVLVGGN